jgi:hypothetical protein
MIITSNVCNLAGVRRTSRASIGRATWGDQARRSYAVDYCDGYLYPRLKVTDGLTKRNECARVLD